MKSTAFESHVEAPVFLTFQPTVKPSFLLIVAPSSGDCERSLQARSPEAGPGVGVFESVDRTKMKVGVSDGVTVGVRLAVGVADGVSVGGTRAAVWVAAA